MSNHSAKTVLCVSHLLLGATLSSCSTPGDHLASADIAVASLAVEAWPPGCSTGVCTARVQLPKSTQLGDWAVVATQSIHLAPRAHVYNAAQQPAPMVSVGDQGVAVGNAATSGSVLSGGDVALDADSLVTGFVSLKGAVRQQAGSVVTEYVHAGASFETYSSDVLSVAMPNSWGPAIALEPGQTQNAVPGTYNGVNVKSGATLRLAQGTYFLTNLYLEPGGNMLLGNADGPVEIHVRDQMSCKGNWQPAATSANVRVIYWGTNSNIVECQLGSTSIVAPNASVRIADRMTAGQVVAKRVEVGCDAKIQHKAFHRLTTGRGDTKLVDLTTSERIKACSALRDSLTTSERKVFCREAAYRAAFASHPSRDADAVTTCNVAFNACMSDQTCDLSPIPTGCSATVNQRDACVEKTRPYLLEAFAGVPDCSDLTLYKMMTYHQVAPLPILRECRSLNGCGTGT